MSLFTIFRFSQIKKKIMITVNHGLQANNYAVIPKKSAAKAQITKPTVQELPVEKDPEKLTKYCCGTNLSKDGHDVELKPDSEYPDWLWKIRTGPAPRLSELDPNTKEYQKLLRKIGIRRLVRSKQYTKKFKN